MATRKLKVPKCAEVIRRHYRLSKHAGDRWDFRQRSGRQNKKRFAVVITIDGDIRLFGGFADLTGQKPLYDHVSCFLEALPADELAALTAVSLKRRMAIR